MGAIGKVDFSFGSHKRGGEVLFGKSTRATEISKSIYSLPLGIQNYYKQYLYCTGNTLRMVKINTRNISDWP